MPYGPMSGPEASGPGESEPGGIAGPMNMELLTNGGGCMGGGARK